MLSDSSRQQASIPSRIKAWSQTIPLFTRCTLTLCCALYTFCLLMGFDLFHPFCLSAADVVERLQLYRQAWQKLYCANLGCATSTPCSCSSGLSRVATAPLLHVGILHLALNMLAFTPIASSLERSLGTILTAHLISLLALIGDAVFVVLSYVLDRWYASRWLHSCALGYSGIIFGLIVIDNESSGISHRSIFGFFSVPAKLYPWALMIFWQILLPKVSFLGHLGGIVAGEAHSRGWLAWAMPSALLLQRIEAAWPISLCTGMDAFIISSGLPTTAIPTLPTSSSASDSGSAAAAAAGPAGAGSVRLPTWMSGGWLRVPTSEHGQQQPSAEAPAAGSVGKEQGSFAGQPRTTGSAGQGDRPYSSNSSQPAQAAAAAAQVRASAKTYK